MKLPKFVEIGLWALKQVVKYFIKIFIYHKWVSLILIHVFSWNVAINIFIAVFCVRTPGSIRLENLTMTQRTDIFQTQPFLYTLPKISYLVREKIRIKSFKGLLKQSKYLLVNILVESMLTVGFYHGHSSYSTFKVFVTDST